MDLLGGASDSDNDDNVAFNTNNEYAERYNTWRQKERLQTLKDRYGDIDINEDDAAKVST